MQIEIKGDIIDNDSAWIYDVLGFGYTNPAKIAEALGNSPDGERVVVEISSPGGMITAGSEIYTMLHTYQRGEIEIRITGNACSAASVIAMAGKCYMSETALMMIHNVSVGGVKGDYRDMQHMAKVLEEANESIRLAYERKTGLSPEKLKDMMDKETWMSAQRAIELGFCDGYIPSARLVAAENGLLIGDYDAAKAKATEILEARKKEEQAERDELDNLFNALKEKTL